MYTLFFIIFPTFLNKTPQSLNHPIIQIKSFEELAIQSISPSANIFIRNYHKNDISKLNKFTTNLFIRISVI